MLAYSALSSCSSTTRKIWAFSLVLTSVYIMRSPSSWVFSYHCSAPACHATYCGRRVAS
jgi:hypothetical protein